MMDFAIIGIVDSKKDIDNLKDHLCLLSYYLYIQLLSILISKSVLSF